jgi:hypothetical protein
MNIQHKHEHLLPREALEAGQFDETIHAALVELSRHRRLTQAEVRLRCITATQPWRKLGINPSMYYRRRRALRLASEAASDRP